MTTIEYSVDADLIERILGEYREMPGLALTLEQAQRLWCCDRAVCQRAVGLLVERRVLAWSCDGLLVRRF